MVKVFNHPLIKDKLTRMRKIETQSTKFRDNLNEISQLMAYEVTKNFEMIDIEIETPVAKTVGQKLKDKVVLIPILRAGLGMVDGLKQLIPTASIGHIGLYRDESTALPKQYYCKMPDCLKDSNAIILDPMLATGGSASEAIKIVKSFNPKSISFMCLVAAPEGLNKILKDHKDINIYIASLDEKLNDKCYIVPGLGDAGDRLFGTK
ncbi:uracil phosphoribosyltransferase [Malacoplasma muris]|uniref:uracil phosphoribosyltransferase n=1 Tax=Malacoplasma muris TaxID=2119 RepID=UPI00398F8948